MKRLTILIALMVFLLVLTGCGTKGVNFPATHVNDIQNNVTTQVQILDWFGKPFNEGTRNGEEIWTYQFDRYSVFGNPKSKDLVILFDKNNVVKAYKYSSNMD
ncbi:MAG: outer membrane protein assembly factor BamE [Nitrospinaceae bacterium]|nr:outer membrane protein assembly factor BamE [Nitrospinaceae bacterium]NIR57334.1 outer membrane protein assembly factor BamE [Nitrospinaceae bacterium]NIS87786.1 outer membrane protein assembly factor BamE [Nitrospinaceae bacterium]NIT84656.1 outer membrane protein assembly factor BamE [Nitrospinaceae bacterium]NIU46835.1 outer membrane protein assembly factor BamE [Nitrospinaceae bacterium]